MNTKQRIKQAARKGDVRYAIDLGVMQGLSLAQAVRLVAAYRG